jgi:ABC-type transport system involved in multi-copper enzyme maturation permease subunit
MSNAFTPAGGESHPGGWSQPAETAPSVMREDQPALARALGLFGAALVTFGGAALIISRFRPTAVGGGWAVFSLTAGIAAMLFHAAFDREVQYRRLYTYFALLSLVVGAFLCVLPYPNAAGDQFGMGFLCLSLALLFQTAVLRNETDPGVRKLIETACLGAGTILAAIGLVGGTLKVEFLAPVGLLLSLLGLAYLIAFVASRGTDNELAYRAGLGLALAGTAVYLIALGRSVYPPLMLWFRKGGPAPHEYLVPAGFLLMGVGAAYLFAALLLVSDNRYVVLIRRELGSFFYSPIAYIVLVAYTIAHGVGYGMFLLQALSDPRPIMEPIVSGFFLQWLVVIVTILIVPVLTMRLLSEEHRSGTFEVLMTTPVSELAVTLSKFIAAFLMFLVTWLPFGLLLIALRIMGGTPFDFRPLLSFYIALSVTGAAFVSIGLFFSSLTKNQIGSAVLTCVAMVVLTMVLLVRFMIQGRQGAGSNWLVLLHHISYLDVWVDSLDGRLMPMYLIFHASVAIFFLFLTTKVLEARKWA